MVRHLILGLLFLLIFPCFATTTGFYGGVQTGMNIFGDRRSDSSQNPGTGVITDLSSRKAISSKSPFGSISVGYLGHLHNIGFAPELCLSYANSSDTISGRVAQGGGGTLFSDIRANQRLSTQMGIQARLGYIHGEYFFYGLGGVQWQKASYTVDLTDIDTGGGTSPVSNTVRKTQYLKGYTLGVGLQKNITKQWSVGLETKLSKFPKSTLEYKTPDIASPCTSTFKNSVFSVGMRINYTFSWS